MRTTSSWVLCASLIPGLASAAADPTDTLVIRPSYSLQYENNLYRLPGNVDSGLFGIDLDRRADTIQSTGIGLRFDKPLGRQRIVADALVQNVRYFKNDYLNHTASDAKFSWLWVVGNQWSGEARYAHRRFLSGFADVRGFRKNLVDQETAALSGRYRFHPRWNATASLEDFNSVNSDPFQQSLDLHTRATAFGLNYVTPAEDTAGIRFKYAQGDYPNRVFAAGSTLANEYDERELSGVFDFRLSGLSKVDGRIGYTDRRYDQLPSRNYSGPTGRGRFTWAPTGKLTLATSGWHEIRTWEDLTSNYIIATGVGLIPTWAVTSKIQLQANLSYENRDFLGAPGFFTGIVPRREDRVGSAQVGGSYLPFRNLELSVFYEQGRRGSTAIFQDYDYRSIFGNVRVSF